MAQEEIRIGPFISREVQPPDANLLAALETVMTRARSKYERLNAQTSAANRQQVSVAFRDWERCRQDWITEKVQQTLVHNRGCDCLFVDFHGATTADLAYWLPLMMPDARRQGFRHMEIITGFGIHSTETHGGVLLPFLTNWLMAKDYTCYPHQASCLVDLKPSSVVIRSRMFG